MTILSLLKRNQEPEAAGKTQPAAREKEEPKELFPYLRKGAPVDILGEDGQAVIKGLITDRNDREITIGRLPGGLSFKLCEIGSGVTARGSDSSMAQFYLRGTVAESSRVKLRLTDLEQKEIQENQRESFRLTVDIPIYVSEAADKNMKLPQKCNLVNISSGGCCISTRDLHDEGEVLRLRIKLEGFEAMDLVGEIIWAAESADNEYRYGILFAQLKREESNALVKMIFHFQSGNPK